MPYNGCRPPSVGGSDPCPATPALRPSPVGSAPTSGAPTARTSPWRSAPTRPASTAAPAVGSNVSEYLLQLQEKQKARFAYGMTEKFHQPLRGGEPPPGRHRREPAALLRAAPRQRRRVPATWAATRPGPPVRDPRPRRGQRPPVNVPSYRGPQGRRHPPSGQGPARCWSSVEHGHPLGRAAPPWLDTTDGGQGGHRPRAPAAPKAHRRPGAEQLIVELYSSSRRRATTSPRPPAQYRGGYASDAGHPAPHRGGHRRGRANRQRFAISPLEPGFSHTLGNSCAAPSCRPSRRRRHRGPLRRRPARVRHASPA